MKTISLEIAESTLSELVKQVADGEEIIITKNDLLLAKLTAFQPTILRLQ